MMFWWSKARLAEFIESYIVEKQLLETIESLTCSIKDIQDAQPVPVDIEAVVTRKVKAVSATYTTNFGYLEKRVEKLERSQTILPDKSENSLDIDKIAATIKAEYIQYINATIAENNSSFMAKLEESIAHQKPSTLDREEIVSEIVRVVNEKTAYRDAQINGTLANYENMLKQLANAVEKKSNDVLIGQIQKDYEEEKKKTATLTEIVSKQSEGIASLSKMVEELRNQVGVLSDKLNGKVGGNEEPVIIPTSISKKALCFDEDMNANKCKLLGLMDQAKLLKERLTGMGMDDADVYVKLVDNLVDKLNKLCQKNAEKQYAANQLAYETVKILKQTIIKGMTQEKIKDYFIQYMKACEIRKLEWSVGKKMTNDDYEYLEEPIMYKEVSDEKMVGAILEIVQDTYVIDYYEDDEKYEAIIPGLYRIGK